MQVIVGFGDQLVGGTSSLKMLKLLREFDVVGVLPKVFVMQCGVELLIGSFLLIRSPVGFDGGDVGFKRLKRFAYFVF